MTHQISPLTFPEFCLLLRTDQAEQALAQHSEASALQPAERIYLRAWQAAQQKRWEKLSACLQEFEDPATETYRATTRGMTVRRRRSWMCWLLGNLAMQVKQHEDAFGWYTCCLQYLNERRMNDTRLRIHALCGRGMALLRMGAFQAGLGEFELASSFCQEGLHEQQVYAGLCEAHARLNQAEQALVYGRKALPMTPDARQKNALRLLLARLYAQQGEAAQAATLCFETLEVARLEEQHDEAAHSLLLLAELDASKGQIDSARIFCEQALLHAYEGSSGTRGSLYLLCGRLALAEEKLEEAARWYMKAVQIFAEPDAACAASTGLAEAHSALARMCEESGQLAQASLHWKMAYQAVHPASSEG
jgi:tetratricopeptide (TPR) repeat protein